MNKKVYVVGRQTGYASWIDDCELVNNINDAKIVLFTGGEDVDPRFYGCKRHPSTWSTPERDEYEIKMFNKMRKDQLALGICRGLQLLNVLNGGILIQDVSNHAIGRTHEITDGYTSYDITSLHHQMVYPWTIKPEYFQILFKSFNTRSDYYEGDKIDLGVVVQNGEPEVVLYQVPDKPVCLGIQGHPEMMPQDRPVVKMFNKLLNSLI